MRTPHLPQTLAFWTDVLGLEVGYAEEHLVTFDLPDGSQVELFDESYPGKEHLVTGPVVEYWVDDLTTTRTRP